MHVRVSAASAPCGAAEWMIPVTLQVTAKTLVFVLEASLISRLHSLWLPEEDDFFFFSYCIFFFRERITTFPAKTTLRLHTHWSHPAHQSIQVERSSSATWERCQEIDGAVTPARQPVLWHPWSGNTAAASILHVKSGPLIILAGVILC